MRSPRSPTPEDVILKKMVFYRDGGSDKHLRDIAGILKISSDAIDLAGDTCRIQPKSLHVPEPGNPPGK
ncbi:MAG: hypothetical protein EHM31_00745 [Candidatus Aminicenantes bacterium]|nr:MAG: hypothetical protein EHM31_00745 [Candidatus Aminicenantes bacterium]